MANRYGSGREDFEAEAAALKRRRLARQELAAKEEAYQRSLAATEGLESQTARANAVRNRARREGLEVAKREQQVADKSVRNVNLDTAAIERNTAARRRNAAAREQQARRAAPGLAVQGARDPAFAAAHALAENGNVTQYRIRQQLEGVGSRRATALQAAVQAGFRPSAGGALANQPLTRSGAAELALDRAKVALRDATQGLTRAIRSEDEAAIASAQATRDAARKRVLATNSELKSANAEVAARSKNAVAAEREAAARQKAAAAAEAAALKAQQASAGREVVRHPTLYGTGAANVVDYSDTEKRAGGRYMPVTPVTERGGGGSYGSGDAAYDARFEKAQAKKATAAEAAAGKIAAAEAKVQASLVKEANAQRAATVAAEQHAVALSQEQRAAILLSESRVDRMLSRQAAAQRMANAQTQASGVAYGSVSNAIRRHGALTTEFIAATARGESTLRELGNQSLATIGKFAGWTAAASAVYGAAAAIGQLKEGALAAASGVSELSRYTTRDLPGGAEEQKRRFGELAQRYNVPVEDVVAATAGTAKVFGGDLPQAFKAAETALAAMKVGELSAAESTLALTAITNGFKLSAEELPGLLDTVNQAQQRFGGNTGDLVKGVGKAGGAFRNAGGDYKQLIALLATGSRVTGASQENVATAIQRSVSSSLTQAGQLRLKAVGIDPNQTFPKIFEDAAKLARTASPAEADRIARALVPAGGQFTRILVPLLQNKDLYDKVLTEISGPGARGSTDRELAAVKGKASEQIKAVGVNLQALGASIAASGALAPLGVMLKTLNLLLTTTNDLVGVFNQLPAPIRTSVAALAEIAAAVALLRRLGATDKLANSPLGFLANPDRRLKSYATKGLRDVQTEAKQELESQARRQFRASLAAEAAQTQAREYTQSPAFTRTRTLPIDHPERIAATGEAERLGSVAQQAERKRVLIARETEALTRAVAVHTQQLAVIEGTSTKNVRQRLAALQIAIPASLEVANLEGIRRAPGGLPSRAGAGAAATPLAGADATRGAYSGLIQAGQRRDQQLATMSRENNRLGHSARLTIRAANGARTATAAAVGFMGRAASSLRGAGGGLKSLIAGFGVLDAAIIAFIAGQALKGWLEKRGNEITGAIDRSGREEAESIRRMNQTLARIAGRPISLQTGTQLSAVIDRDAQERQAGVISQAEFDRRRKVHAIELQHLYSRVVNLPNEATAEQRKAAAEADRVDQRRAQLALSNAARQANPREFARALVGKTPDELEALAQSTATNVQSRTAGRGGLRQATQIYQAQVDALGGSADPKDIQALDSARSAYFTLLQENAAKEIKSGLRSAGSEAARRSIFSTQVSQLRRLQSSRRRAFESTEKAVAEAREDRDSAAQASTASPGDRKLKQEAERTAKRYIRLRLRMTKLKDDMTASEARTAEILQQIQDESYDDRSSGRDIQAAYEKSKTRDPLAQTRIDVSRAKAQVDDAKRTYGANSRQTKQAITALNEAQNAQQDAIKEQSSDTARLTDELAVARAGGDAVLGAEAARSAARRAIRSASTKNERLQGLIDLANANNELEQALRDREVARLDLLASRTTDPVQEARLEVKKAQAALKGTSGTERLQGRAAVNRAQQALRDATLGEKEGDIEFERSMGRISVQDAIDRYTSLLSIRNLTKQQKRDIQQKIHDLQSEAESEASGFDLDVGGLKLPTVYDVRRAMDPIRQQYAANARRRAMDDGGSPSNVRRMADYRGGDATQNITVNVHGGDPDAVYTAIDRALKTNVRAQVRARGRR